jgi:hypothetical protein
MGNSGGILYTIHLIVCFPFFVWFTSHTDACLFLLRGTYTVAAKTLLQRTLFWDPLQFSPSKSGSLHYCFTLICHVRLGLHELSFSIVGSNLRLGWRCLKTFEAVIDPSSFPSLDLFRLRLFMTCLKIVRTATGHPILSIFLRYLSIERL